MANKFAADPAAEDRRTLLTVLAIGQYLRQFCGQDTVAAPRVVSWGNTSWKGRYNMVRLAVGSRSEHKHGGI